MDQCSKQQIPKIIHYCWFGGKPLPELAKKCIQSWKQYCPDYEIRQWDETNFSHSCSLYAEQAYEAGKWAFVSDIARLHALKKYGGIYMDTDVELIKSLDALMNQEGFCCFETNQKIATCLMAAKPDHPFIVEFLDSYHNESFQNADGTFNTATNVKRISKLLTAHGLAAGNDEQSVAGLTIYPSAYFCPKDFNTGKITITSDTYAIHHFDGSWWTEEDHYIFNLSKQLQRLLPMKASKQIAKFIGKLKYRGITETIHEVVRYLCKDRNEQGDKQIRNE